MSSRLRISSTVMSRRQPNQATVFNDCDNIERQMQEDEHKIWGWVVYRSDYSSEEDWQEFLQRLRHVWITTSLKIKTFLTATIREHFRVWAATASEQEQGAGPARSQRYQFCIQVDSDALHSVVHNPLSPGDSGYRNNRGWVKLIWKDWEPAADDAMEWRDEQPVEGIALNDVGWCRATYEYIMPTMYAMIRSRNDWYREYRRPPKVIHG
ncbi:hypothetical protein M409DRAFT_59571 [Zasmidium cellare ATCC 36951]|uniref:Uncharacterized protein n=1 Tax=Zasmidium cellare ATCC 36951 TaxID=1080233 RepID=A0A6A6C1F2_ZASCE|nr:uncharacterized protein M409DRAFT_59571 [Zasmidium cellare ATCC 36951]KAF2160775.1 hypothetical protein M409DRAFT_59571 [Zasmidium cellare ATCC 36951]